MRGESQIEHTDVTIDQTPPSASPHRSFRIVGLGYVSLYFQDHDAAIAFYSQVLGPPEYSEDGDALRGWRMGATWLTVFAASAGSGKAGNPRNTEFAIRVTTSEEVDALFAQLVAAGAQVCMAPRDTTMYEPMRFACVDDPFGVRIDVWCPR
jgi:uncharacterized glyoxalase superfamily protein PhnB